MRRGILYLTVTSVYIIIISWSTNLLENDLKNLRQEIIKSKQFDANSRLPFTYAEYSIEQFQ